MVSPQAESLHKAYRRLRESTLASGHRPSVEEQRANSAAVADMATEPEGITTELVDADGVEAMWVVPEGGDPDRVIQYVHGGGYVIGSMHHYRRFCGHLANAAGCRVLNVEYRLAPEHPHPAAVTDACTAYRWLLAQGIQPQHIALSGDSAGGGLTVATLVALRDAGDPLPAAAAPISPWVDLEGVGDSMTANAELDLIVAADGLASMAAAFLDGGDPHDPLAAPLHAELRGLPPLYIQVGGDETLLDDSRRLADKAGDAGVEVELEVFPQMQHVFQVAVGRMPEATEAVAKLGAWLSQRLGAAPAPAGP